MQVILTFVRVSGQLGSMVSPQRFGDYSLYDMRFADGYGTDCLWHDCDSWTSLAPGFQRDQGAR